MLGAIIGDIVGSRFEWNNHKSKDFELFSRLCMPTDDSVMTLAIAKALLLCNGDPTHLSEQAVSCMQTLGRKYPHCGYGTMFNKWLNSNEPKPYNSYGNGAAMRVEACGSRTQVGFYGHISANTASTSLDIRKYAFVRFPCLDKNLFRKNCCAPHGERFWR